MKTNLRLLLALSLSLGTIGQSYAQSKKAKTSADATSATNGKTVSVTQGGVGRWAGNCARCSFGQKAWLAVNGTCYYPVDMEMKPGTYTISRRTTGGKLESAKLIVTEKSFKEENFNDFPKKEYVNVSAQNLARNRKELALVLPLLSANRDELPPVFDLPVGKPAEPLPQSEGNFGSFRTFDGQERDRHTGTDFPVTAGKPVRSLANGRVLLAANHFFSGNSIYIDHGNGLISEYFHLKTIGVKDNETVKKGQKIGEVGQTGRTTGPHLHLGVRWHGARINPGLLLIDPAELPDVAGETTSVSNN
ncbi:MAG: M23 family metallopeptidase [Cytophagaceae bacterium]|nr:M23 family metallopeptidase [Cytophagaceae bacterium]